MWDFGAEADNSVEVTQLVSCSLASESAVPHIQDVDWKGLKRSSGLGVTNSKAPCREHERAKQLHVRALGMLGVMYKDFKE